MSGEYQVVQFIHPGFEYTTRKHAGSAGQQPGVMAWKAGLSKHNRKFLLSIGSAYDRSTGYRHDSVALGFWGEWEGPSVFWHVKSEGRPLPSTVHAPFRPEHPPATSFQNTDPLVFGDAFIYSNCMQQSHPVLRTLSPGSIVLFGRHSRTKAWPHFSLDTCLVIARSEKQTPAPARAFGSSLLNDAVLAPLASENAGPEPLTVYYGRGYAEGEPFSFTPAHLAADEPSLFARPDLSPTGALDSVINPALRQGIRLTERRTLKERDAIWEEVAAQVSRQGCLLGYHAAAPPTLTQDAASQKASGPISALPPE